MERRNYWKCLMDQKKKILVLGSKGGLGSRIVRLLTENHQSNYQIISLSRDCLQTENTTKKVRFNATDHVKNQQIFEDIDENYGPIWAVIDATGLSISGKYTKTIWETITQQIDVNLFHPLNVCSYFLKSMAKNNLGGRLIFFSSVLVRQDVIGTTAYTISKTALEKAVKSISKEIYTENLTINCIRLGYFNFGMISQIKNPVNIGGHSLGDIQDIAPTLVNILSEDSNRTNGQIIEILGGST